MDDLFEDDVVESKDSKEFVKIICFDGYDFVVSRQTAMMSGTFKSMLADDSFAEGQSGIINIPEIRVIMAKVIEYLAYKAQYEKATTKDHVPDFLERIDAELALELLMAADYLEA